MNARKLTRRKFINRTAGVIGGALLFPGGPIATLAPQGAWALKLSKMDSHQGETLLQMTRLIYPHEKLEDAVYALVVKRLDSSDNQNLELLVNLRIANFSYNRLEEIQGLDKCPLVEELNLEHNMIEKI